MSLYFTNQNISPDELPKVETIEFHPLEPDFLKVERISVMIILAVILIAASSLFMIFDNFKDLLVVIPALFVFLLFAAFLFVSTEISFKFSGYALREKDIVYRSGWIIRKERIVMLNRIQHVSVQSGPIERKYGLSSVSLFTAGASDADFTIKGIKAETAGQIKKWISNRLNGETS
jgi:uncharacterized protein